MEPNPHELKAIQEAVQKALDGIKSKVLEIDERIEKTSKGIERIDNLKRTQDELSNAVEEAKRLGNTLESKTNDKLRDLGEKQQQLDKEHKEQRDRLLTLEQGGALRPGGQAEKSIYQEIIESAQYKAAKASPTSMRMEPVVVGNWHRRSLGGIDLKTQIVNASGASQPLVPEIRVPGIITPAQQRLFMRDILPVAPIDGNLVQFTQESSFTNNARAQGDTSPVGLGEGENFAESAMAFTLTNTPVSTIGHFIPASRQVLSDASLLQGHMGTRLIYGLKLAEENQIITGDGGANSLDGINNQAAAYSRGVTNDTALDTLLKSLLQVTLSDYEADGIILHPVDWWDIQMLKDTTNRYLFVDPANMTTPRLWGKNVIHTASQTEGQFTAGAFALGAQLWDREDAQVEIAREHASFFVQGMVAILATERVALTVFRTTAFVYGAISHAG